MIRIAGYAALFGRVDRADDLFRAGAFGDAPAPVPLLWQHRGAPVGRIETIAPDARGLRIIALVDDADAARLVRARALPGLSVGYRPRAVAQGARRAILRADLVEISLVAVPMQPAARIDTVTPVTAH